MTDILQTPSGSTSKQKRISELLLVTTTILWGTTFIITNTVTQVVPPMFYMGVRYLIGFLAFLPFLAHLKRIDIKQLKIAFIASFLVWASFALQTIGIKLTTATKSAFITGLNVIMVPIFIAIFYKKKVPVKIWISTVLALLGVSIMTFGGFDSIELGDILVLICDVFYALYIIYLDNNLKHVDTIGFSIILVFLLSFCSFIVSFIFEPIDQIFGDLSSQIFTLGNLWIMLYMGVVATMIATLTQTFGQRHVNSTRTAIIFALEPLFATFFAVLGNESLNWQTIIGGIIIILGIFISIERAKPIDGPIDLNGPQITQEE
ncbi:hypothetical protein NEF87_000932 [Candidatus Lokiarchaeum ossiferum]|uniref:EamA domain-containing protein n=1 Tax=Candidatus Lokiarchaeum ossiferum TaxID=2951803 RepID=A0ABY6HQH1_9ARCH|nr:hypothetical protein NEF87_000932 [Candidatus Lokiarchaeum sp. B-35]